MSKSPEEKFDPDTVMVVAPGEPRLGVTEILAGGGVGVGVGGTGVAVGGTGVAVCASREEVGSAAVAAATKINTIR